MDRKYDIHTIKEFLKDDSIYTSLVEYCKYLAYKYNSTNEGKYRIKYNSLYPLLHNPISDCKIEELFNSFATSLNIFPIVDININGISLQSF